MFGFLSELIAPAVKIADKMVMDKDKYADLQFKKAELKHEAQMALLQQTTTPTIDAWVKILLALRDIIIPMFRPLGSLAMAAFSAYCIKEGIELPEYLKEALFAPSVMWGYSRYKEKTKEG